MVNIEYIGLSIAVTLLIMIIYVRSGLFTKQILERWF